MRLASCEHSTSLIDRIVCQGVHAPQAGFVVGPYVPPMVHGVYALSFDVLDLAEVEVLPPVEGRALRVPERARHTARVRLGVAVQELANTLMEIQLEEIKQLSNASVRIHGEVFVPYYTEICKPLEAKVYFHYGKLTEICLDRVY